MGGRSQSTDEIRHFGGLAEAVTPPPWHERARDGVVAGVFDADLASEAEHLARMGRLTQRDLRMLLLVADDHPGWAPARRHAVEGLRDTPEVPQQVLSAHAQAELWPPLTYEESTGHLADGRARHTAAARLGPPDGLVTGPARSGPTAALARRAAAHALLHRLAGVEESDAAPVPSDQVRGQGRLTLQGLSTEVFEALLQSRVTEQRGPGAELMAEIARRADCAQLRQRDIQLLLFDAGGPAWREPRVRALRFAARTQTAASTLLRRYADARGAELRHTVVASDGAFSCRWSWDGGDGRTVDGAERTRRDRREAVHRGAVALLAELTDLPEPEDEPAAPESKAAGRPAPRIRPVPAGQDPVKYLNKYTQLEMISKPEPTFTAAPKSVLCTYTCTLVRTGAEVSVSRRDQTRAGARRAAASALMAELVTLDAGPSRSVPAQTTSAGRPASGSPGFPEPPGVTGTPRFPEPPGVSGTPRFPEPPETSDARTLAGSPPGEGAPPAESARAAVERALAAGCALAFVPADGAPAGLLLHRPDGAPMPGNRPPAPLAVTRRGLLPPRATAAVSTPASASSPASTPGSVSVSASGWRVPLADAVPVLLSRARDAAWHPTAVGWADATRLGLGVIAAGLVHPALTADGVDRWRVGPLPDATVRAAGELVRRMAPYAHAVAVGGGRVKAGDAVPEFLDALADGMLRPPAAVLFGSGPFLAPVGRPLPEADVAAVRPWLDTVEDRLDEGPLPGLVVEFAEPSEEEAAAGRLTARLLVVVDPARPDDEVPADALHGPEPVGGVEPFRLRARVRRRLERAARCCDGALDGLAGLPARFVRDSTGIGQLLDAERDLESHGLTLRWPSALRDLLSAGTVIGADPHENPDADHVLGTGNPVDGDPEGAPRRVTLASGIPLASGSPLTSHSAGGAPRFSLRALLDFRWQFALGEDVLTEAELDELAEATRPLVRVRDRWVLLDPVMAARVRHRLIGRLSGADALAAALTGTVDVDGRTVPCRAGGGLAAVVEVLRRGEHAVPVPAPAGLDARLRAYQERALAWLAHTGGIGFGAVLADDMGLGKTLTAIAYTLYRYENGHRGPVLVVCPSSLVTNWEREFGRFAPHLDVVVHHGARRSLDAAGDRTVVLTTYGVLRRDDELTSRTWDLVIADEAQHAKNHGSATAHRLRALDSTTRLALSGTPVENNLSELWSLLDWANPGLFGPLKTFRSRYAAAAEREPDGPAAHALARLIAPFLLRRRKTDPHVAPELPAKVETRRIVELTAEQVALYEAVVRETMEQITASPSLARSGLVFKLITALKQITNHPAHYWGEEHPGPSRTGEFAARSAKLEALGELVETITGRGEALLVFTSYVTMGRLLTEHLTHLGHRPLFLHGGLDTGQRQELVDAFQAGRSPVFVLSLKAGGTGLTLTRASHVVHFDRSWNAAVEDQASDRAHRIGQRRTVTVHRLVTRGTIEDRIDQLLTHKRALQDTVLGAGESGVARLGDRELAELVALGGRR
ncbi:MULTISPECIES: DEAD/DEAH box helicase [unclassified Streptomyces]|uniref:DEAD/DEAH box helicase n=1 Tax=unclassified Streptomyces TaxID=2593676 RepID=UPI0006F7AE99|nr:MULTISPECIES: DEAD/DEAH box helicase [unclassified Streptomyces]KQX54702.1 hypothetical protein ASD33_32290 [Streptomyces sp. Root1304]KRA93518.1 hypothetical protein ASE09_32075 [Streptomyces sp. Root66D1]